MSSYVLRIDEENAEAKCLLNYIKELSEVTDFVEIIPQIESGNFAEEYIGKFRNL